MSDATISLSNVGKCYGSAGGTGEAEQWAVRSVTLSVYPGELTVLMGPSGSGKTTLLSMIGGLLDVTHGRLSVLDESLERKNEGELQQFRRQKIGFVFQNFNLLSALTAGENIEVALKLRGHSSTTARELLASVGLSEKLAAYPSNLSGGQRQRVGIARALAGDPPILLADEPTAALDTVHGRSVMELLRKHAHERGTTVLVVTHDPRVRELSDRVIEMEDGGLKQIVRRIRQPNPDYPRTVTRNPNVGRLAQHSINTKQNGARHGTI